MSCRHASYPRLWAVDGESQRLYFYSYLPPLSFARDALGPVSHLHCDVALSSHVAATALLLFAPGFVTRRDHHRHLLATRLGCSGGVDGQSLPALGDTGSSPCDAFVHGAVKLTDHSFVRVAVSMLYNVGRRKLANESEYHTFQLQDVSERLEAKARGSRGCVVVLRFQTNPIQSFS